MPDFPRRPVYASPRLVIEFQMDRSGMREVARNPVLRGQVRAIAQKAKIYAETISPRETGAYASSFQIDMSRIMVRGMRRIAARLVNTDPAAIAIEVGTSGRGGRGGTPAHRVLQKTLAYISGTLGTGHMLLSTPTRRAVELQPVPTIDEFRDRQRLQRESQRRRSRRR